MRQPKVLLGHIEMGLDKEDNPMFRYNGWIVGTESITLIIQDQDVGLLLIWENRVMSVTNAESRSKAQGMLNMFLSRILDGGSID